MEIIFGFNVFMKERSIALGDTKIELVCCSHSKTLFIGAEESQARQLTKSELNSIINQLQGIAKEAEEL